MYQDSRIIPVVFHNLSKYDGHFLIKEVSKGFSGNIRVLPLTKENYISFSVYTENHFQRDQCKKYKKIIQFRFIDSLRFLNSSLDKLSSFLTTYPEIEKYFPDLSPDKFQLLLRKGIFPYEWMDSKDKLSATELPKLEDFYSSLNDDNVSNDDYAHALKVWKDFEIKNFGEYLQLYMTLDILLLSCVFENFRKNSLQAYGLDACFYYTTPGIAWDAMLKMTRVKLDLLTDIDMVMWIESGIRGGISQCANRYSKANNKFMENYNPQDISKFIMYYDINNLYGHAMIQNLPTGDFRWLEREEINAFDLENMSDDNVKGYFLEVDLNYPVDLHNQHNDLPFCPIHEAPEGSKEKKLLTTLGNKKNYVIHYRYLKQVVSNGLQITKIHKILEFSQSPWLAQYINKNTELRMNAKNDFEKNFYKLMNNSVYGKTMENVRKRVDVKLIKQWEGRYGAESYISKPTFKSCAIFSKDLVAIELRKTQVIINKPIYIGLCVLDLSKILLYDFHYQYMQKKFANNCKLLYTDTDSLIYEIICENIYDLMKEDLSRFDTSDYPKDNIYNMPRVNNKVLGLMKDECNGKIVTEFVGLRSKMYSVKVEDKDRIKKAKGLKSNVIKNTITFEHFKDCLFNAKEITREQRKICSKFHMVYTEKENKIALSPFDNKRYVKENCIDTYAWGHVDIPRK